MDVSKQIEKRLKLDAINHEITSLYKKYQPDADQEGVFRITDPVDRKKLERLLKLKEGLENKLDEA